MYIAKVALLAKAVTGKLPSTYYWGLPVEPIPERLIRILDPLDHHRGSNHGH